MNHRLSFLFAALVLLLPFAAHGQQDSVAVSDTLSEYAEFLVPDYEQLGQVIADPTSHYYYPSLLKRFAEADTSLTIEEIHCLYYGYVLQKDYDPYIRINEEEQARDILNQEKVTKKDAQKALKLLDRAVEKAPMHLRLYMYRHYANKLVYGEDSKQVADDAFRYVALISAIAASGDGSDFETAFHVAIVAHSYNFMNYFGFKPTNQSLQFNDGQQFDVFSLEENEYDIETMYFDVTTCLNSLSKLFGDDDEPSDVEQYDIGLGTKVTIRLGEQKKGVYRFSVEQIDIISDTLELDDAEKLVPQEGDPNTIVFYCVHGRWSSGKTSVLLIVKNYTDVNLSYDTFMMLGDGQFRPTSNNGLFSKVLGTEIWNDPIHIIRIANLRAMK